MRGTSGCGDIHKPLSTSEHQAKLLGTRCCLCLSTREQFKLDSGVTGGYIERVSPGDSIILLGNDSETWMGLTGRNTILI